jgi:pimeloyl-ACP methyl ester carboxylesterase
VSLAGGGLVAAGPGTAAVAAPRPAPAASTPAAAATVHWRRCADRTLRAFRARCASLKVPLDYAHPSGAKVTLALSRVRHTVPAARYQGVMLVNPGGPGASGRSLSILGPVISNGFGRKDAGGAYDWIGFDPRGVGASKPSLSCEPAYFGPDRPDYVPTSVALLHRWRSLSRGYARACDRTTGRLLEHIHSTDLARDMDRIRLALGARQINYYGFSYGTYLGQVYNQLFPGRVRRLVLDSNVDPRDVWYDANLAQDLGFDANLTRFFRWVAQHNARYRLGGTEAAVERLWFQVQRGLDQTPYLGQVGSDEWADAFLFAGYAQSLWPDFADMFSTFVLTGDGTAVRDSWRSTDGTGDDSEFAAYLATTCTDARWKGRDFIGDNWRTHYRAPFYAWGNAWFNGPCLFWPARAGRPLHITGAGVGEALLLDETHDAATPYGGSLFLRSIYRRARLVAVKGGTSHAVTPSGNPCTDNKIFNYLATGRLPARRAGGGADVLCQAPPKPRPNAPTTPAPAFGATTPNRVLAAAASTGDATAGRLLLTRLLLRANRF